MNLDRDLLESPFSLVGDPERDLESLLDCAELEIKYPISLQCHSPSWHPGPCCLPCLEISCPWTWSGTSTWIKRTWRKYYNGQVIIIFAYNIQ